MKKLISTILSVCIFASVMGVLCFNNNVEVSAKTKLSNRYTLVNASKKTVKKNYVQTMIKEMYYFPWEGKWDSKQNDIDFAMHTILHPGYENGFYSYFKKNLFGKWKRFNYKDPKKQFSVAHVLNADKVDWLMRNVMNTKPDRTFSTERYYYHKNKVYISSDGGGSIESFKLAKLKKVKKARYKLVFKVDMGGEELWDGKVTVEAELRKSPVIGVYWSYHSFKKKM